MIAATGRPGAGAAVPEFIFGAPAARRCDLLASVAMSGRVGKFDSTGRRQIIFDRSIGTRMLRVLSMSISTKPAFVAGTLETFRARARPLLGPGAFRPVVDTVLPLGNRATAHATIDSRGHCGKITTEVP